MIVAAPKIGIRWTIGNVSPRGFEELRLSILGAALIFGREARYAVCVNSIPVPEAQQRLGQMLVDIEWIDARDKVPEFLQPYLDGEMSEGVAWKFAPFRLFPQAHELSLDNDCILWREPAAIEDWLGRDDACLMAEDVRRCLGQFDSYCPPGNRNSGIRGLPPGFDLRLAMEKTLHKHERASGAPVVLRSELDEQGLQAAAIAESMTNLLVGVEEVSICSPFWPHRKELGSCGAHFVGSNARHFDWKYYDRPAHIWMEEHWAGIRPKIYEKLGFEEM